MMTGSPHLLKLEPAREPLGRRLLGRRMAMSAEVLLVEQLGYLLKSREALLPLPSLLLMLRSAPMVLPQSSSSRG